MKTANPRPVINRLSALNEQAECNPLEYAQIEKTLLEMGYCPSCACEGHKAKLRPWSPGNFYEYAGRECMECEEFYPMGEQPCYEVSPSPSDADPGL